jgi:surface protein
MFAMFHHASAFNQRIDNWDVSNVKNMAHMFHGASAFNQDISRWDVSNVTSMHAMFAFAGTFNRDIANWDVSNVKYMNFMFYAARSFDQNLNAWYVPLIKRRAYGFSFYGNYNFNKHASSRHPQFGTSRPRSLGASDPELFGCQVYVNNTLVHTMEQDESRAVVDVQDGDVLTFNNCYHYDEQSDTYIPWEGTLSSFVNNQFVSANGEESNATKLIANPLTTMINSSSSASQELEDVEISEDVNRSLSRVLKRENNASEVDIQIAEMENIKNILELFTGVSLDVDLNSSNIQKQLLDAINKPTQELYTDPIEIKNDTNETVVSVDKPSDTAVAYVAAVATAIEMAGMQQKTVGLNSNLSDEQLSKIGQTALDAITVDTNESLDEKINSALELVSQTVTQSIVATTDEAQAQLDVINENNSKIFARKLTETVSNVKTAIENGEDIKQVLIEQSKSIQESEEIKSSLENLAGTENIATNSINTDIVIEHEGDVITEIFFNSQFKPVFLSKGQGEDDYVSKLNIDENKTMQIENKKDGKVSYSLTNSNKKTQFNNMFAGTKTEVKDDEIINSYLTDYYTINSTTYFDGKIKNVFTKDNKSTQISVNNEGSSTTIDDSENIITTLDVSKEGVDAGNRYVAYLKINQFGEIFTSFREVDAEGNNIVFEDEPFLSDESFPIGSSVNLYEDSNSSTTHIQVLTPVLEETTQFTVN